MSYTIGYMYLFKLMVTGVAGRDGLAAQRHVDLAEEVEQESATTQLQLMEAEPVGDQALNLDIVTPTAVQVNHHIIRIVSYHQQIGQCPCRAVLHPIILRNFGSNPIESK